jgi:hypothetical protein
MPGSVTVTFRLTLTGPVPADAAFAVGDGIVGLEQHAVYLCVYYGGTAPPCASGGSYDDAWSVPPGTRLSYFFWRELGVNGGQEDMERGEFTVGATGQVVSVTYNFPP